LADTVRDPGAEAPGPFGSTFSGQRKFGPLNSIPAQAYRPLVFRLINQLSPNPRLQRTPSASPPSPLSRKPFGDS